MENSSAPIATRLDGTDLSSVQAGLSSVIPAVPLYTFSIPSLVIDNTRSLHEDTDYVSLTLAVGTNPPQTKTLKIGNVNNGTHTVGLSFDGISVPAGQNAVLTYAVVNNGHASEADVESALEKAGDALGQKAAQAAASAIGGLVGAELGASIGTAAVPVLGTALGVIAGWLVGELSGIVFADCDGPVAAGVHIFTAADLAGETAGGAVLSATDHSPGTNSAWGCGSNSDYYVTWSVNAGAAPPPTPRPIGGGPGLPEPGPGRQLE
ncbi:MAG: hypothetical protein ACLPYS_20970 [Vulcanimicrobiaceae bacterium]